MQSSSSFMLDGASSDTYEATEMAQLDATFRSTDEITNMDVEMQIPLTDRWTIIVLDTNILLEFLDIIQVFVSEAEQQRLPVLIIIPGAVIYELDAQKNRNNLSWFARRASTWLLKKVKERKSVKGQALDETCKSSGNWKTKERGEQLGRERVNDSLILDCCQYFFRVRQCRTFLCSKDKILAVEAESVGIPTLSPNQKSFCSRDIALAVFGPEALVLRFSGHFPSYRGNVMEDTTDVKGDDADDGMDIDDDSAVTELVRPSHALDGLHLQVIDHFGELLLELVGKVAGLEGQKFGTVESTSRHAPGYARKQLMFWTTTDSLEFLNTKKAWPHSSPRLDVFLMRPREGRGARRGQDWSRRDWEVALSTLGEIGGMWSDSGCSIRESVRAVEAEMRRVFELAMRPTGVGVINF